MAMNITSQLGITSGSSPWDIAGRIVVDRRPTSVERLGIRLMARALSHRRVTSTRIVAIALLLLVGPFALASKSIGYAIWLANHLTLVLAAFGIWWWLLRSSPGLLDLLRQDLHALGLLLVSLT